MTPEQKKSKAERQRAYMESGKGREALRRYNHSEKGKIVKRRFHGRPTPTRPMPALCECCGGAPDGAGKLHEDHNHVTGKFRGWICSSCNRALGLLGDTMEGVRNAFMYLVRNEDSIDT